MTTKKLKQSNSLIRIIDKLFKTGREVPLYDEDSPLDRMLMAKALFLAWIALNYVILISTAIFFYFWKDTRYALVFLSVLGGYSLLVILISLLLGYSYLLQQNYYEKEGQEESPANFNS